MNHILVLFYIMVVIVWIGGSRKLAGDGLSPSWARRWAPECAARHGDDTR